MKMLSKFVIYNSLFQESKMLLLIKEKRTKLWGCKLTVIENKRTEIINLVLANF